MSNVKRLTPPRNLAGRSPLTRLPELVISSRFRGPAGSGNGGYVCGRIAAYADGPLAVTLRRPPPLATPLTVEPADDGSLFVRHGSMLIAEATFQASPLSIEVPVPASLADARMSAGHARYFQDPLFPQCFVCGPSRSPGDGLRVFPGAIPGRTLWAAPWTPDSSVTGKDGRVRPEVAWAALDCPSGIAAAEHARLGRDTAIVLGQMTASLTTLPAAGEQCRLIAWPEGGAGRRLTAGSALIGPGDEVLGAARAVWVTVPRPVERTAGAAS